MMLEAAWWLIDLLLALVFHQGREPQRDPSLGDFLRRRDDV